MKPKLLKPFLCPQFKMSAPLFPVPKSQLLLTGLWCLLNSVLNRTFPQDKKATGKARSWPGIFWGTLELEQIPKSHKL